ncbi:MAG: hypothetical protein ACLU0O_11780 [Collinsella sp.]
MAEVNNSRAEVDQAIADAKAGISGAKTDYDSTFSVKAKELEKTISGVLDSLNGISGDLDSAVSGLTDASGSLAKGLSKAAGSSTRLPISWARRRTRSVPLRTSLIAL